MKSSLRKIFLSICLFGSFSIANATLVDASNNDANHETRLGDINLLVSTLGDLTMYISDYIRTNTVFGNNNVVSTNSVVFGNENVVGANSYVKGKYNDVQHSSYVFGTGNIASNDSSYVLGSASASTNDGAFVWNYHPSYDSEHSQEEVSFYPKYYSHGKGSFNINPVGGLQGFYIGETNMQTIIDEIKRYSDKNNEALQAQINNVLMPFMLYDFGQVINTTLYPVTNAITIDDRSGRIDVHVPTNLVNEWKIANVIKYELFNNTSRVESIKLYEFSMNTQKTIRIGFRTTGNASKTVNKIQGSLFLIRRDVKLDEM